MNLIIKIILSYVLILQFCFAESVLVYQKPTFKSLVSYMQTKPTFEELSVVLALAKLDPSIISKLDRILKDRGISKKTPLPDVKINNNQVIIEGLAKPVVIGNSYVMSMSYDGEKIPLTNVNDIDKTLGELETFFSKPNSTSPNYGKGELFVKMILGISAQAVIQIPYLVVFVLIALAAGASRLLINPYLDRLNTSKQEWIFGTEGWKKEIAFKCENDLFVIVNGEQRLSFEYDKVFLDKRLNKNGYENFASPAYKINYAEKNGSYRDYIVFYQEDGVIASETKKFKSTDFNEAKKQVLLELAKVVLGLDGSRKICNGNKFIKDNEETQFTELAKQYNKRRKANDKPLPGNFKKLAPGKNVM